MLVWTTLVNSRSDPDDATERRLMNSEAAIATVQEEIHAAGAPADP
jgi:hypothetical protein